MSEWREVGKVYREVSTLLNPRVAPALDLVELSHERSSIELVLDEIKTHERVHRKVLRSKTPEGVCQEPSGIFLAHYTVRVLMAQAAVQANLDPDRESFTQGLFELTEMIDLALLARAGSDRAAALALAQENGSQGLARASPAYSPARGQAGLQQVQAQEASSPPA